MDMAASFNPADLHADQIYPGFEIVQPKIARRLDTASLHSVRGYAICDRDLF